MDAIPQEELRNQLGAALRRVARGESLTVTVEGRPVAELAPARRRRWVSGAELSKVWNGPTPQGLEDNLASFDAGFVNPFDT